MDASDGYLCGVEGLNMCPCERAAAVIRPICTYVAVFCDHVELLLMPPPQPDALCDDSEALATGAAVGPAIEVCPMCSDGHFPCRVSGVSIVVQGEIGGLARLAERDTQVLPCLPRLPFALGWIVMSWSPRISFAHVILLVGSGYVVQSKSTY